eukprot:Colp12_sorted_trinity150504_noHs@21343
MVVQLVADALGIGPESLVVLFALLFSYPLSYVFRRYVYGLPVVVRHAYLAVAGLSLQYWCYGQTISHLLVCVAVSYIILYFAGKTKIGLALNWVWAMGYLSYGYVAFATESYDINWTVSQCILTLRLIGLAFDYHDFHNKKPEEITGDLQLTALDKLPDPLAMLGFSFFHGAALVGPQYPYKRHREFVEGTLFDKTMPIPWAYVLNRMGLSFVYLGLNTVFAVVMGYTYAHMMTPEFNELPFYVKFFYVVFVGKVALSKYIGVWLLAHGSCVVSGVTYDGKDESGRVKWNRLENCLPRRYETSLSLQGLIESFNINTNLWSMRYCFKRLRFLGNKNLSLLFTLLFLALWHGFHLGYFVTFLFEFYYMDVERKVKSMGGPFYKTLPPAAMLAMKPVLFLIRSYALGFALITFELLSVSKSAVVWGHTYYFGFYAPLIVYAVAMQLPRSKGPKAVKVEPTKEQ